jgi:hypothetical protein
MLTNAEKERPGFVRLVNALTEWDRRFRENPTAFQSEAERLAGDAETYGEAAGRYLVSILDEQRADGPT